MGTYEIHAYDIATGARILEAVPFATFRWAESVNDLALRDSGKRPEFTGVLAPDDSASLASLTPGKTMLVVEDVVNVAPIYAGIVWTWEFNVEQHGFDVWGEGVWSYWRRRVLRSTEGMPLAMGGLGAGAVQFNAVEQFDIVTDLIAHAAATGEGADLQFADVRYNPAASGVMQSTAWFEAQFRTIAAAVEEVARQDDGFDFLFSYAWDAGSPPALLLYLDLWYPRYGSTVATPLVDGDNATVVWLERPAREMANPLHVLEIIEGPTALIATVDDVNRADLGGTFPYLDGVFVTSEHGRDTAGLIALGETRMLYTRGPVYSARVDLQIGGILALADVVPGDTIDLIAAVGGLDVTETERVYARRVEIAAGEQNRWTLDLIDENASVGTRRGTDDLESLAALLSATPVELPAGMFAWWDFSDATTIDFDPATGKVTSVSDKSGNGRDLVQTVDADRPITTTRTLNGLNVLDFVSSDHLGTTADAGAAAVNELAVFVVFQSDVVTPGVFFLVNLGAGWAYPSLFLNDAPNEWAVTGGTAVNFGAADTNPHLMTAVFTGAATGNSQRLDGVEVSTTDPGGADLVNDQIWVGANNGVQDWWNGIIAEVIVYPFALLGPSIETVEAYLLAKWGL